MIRAFTIEAIESMSGEHAPVDKPDPKGTRRCRLTVLMDRIGDGRIVKVEELNPVENKPSTDAT